MGALVTDGSPEEAHKYAFYQTVTGNNAAGVIRFFWADRKQMSKPNKLELKSSLGEQNRQLGL